MNDETNTAPAEEMPLLSLRSVEKTYRMGPDTIRALDGVTLDIHAGEYVVITGPSGSGKSTMLHILGLLDRPDSGQLLYQGQAIKGLSDSSLSAARNGQIGFIFQSFNLLPEQTALQNAMLPLIYTRKSGNGNRRQRATAALERVGLGDRMRHRPSELSGGQQQRVAIARALVKNPILILADEPTGNLDSRAGDEIMTIFDDLATQGIAVVIITHDPTVASHASRHIHLLDGRVTEDRQIPVSSRGSS